jgi:hypothetical protein
VCSAARARAVVSRAPRRAGTQSAGARRAHVGQRRGGVSSGCPRALFTATPRERKWRMWAGGGHRFRRAAVRVWCIGVRPGYRRRDTAFVELGLG